MERILAKHPSYREAHFFENKYHLTGLLGFEAERFGSVAVLQLAEHTLRQRIDNLAAYLNQPGVREWERYPFIYRWVYRNPVKELSLGRDVLRQIPREFDLIPGTKEETGRNLRQTLNQMIETGEIKNEGYKWFIAAKK